LVPRPVEVGSEVVFGLALSCELDWVKLVREEHGEVAVTSCDSELSALEEVKACSIKVTEAAIRIFVVETLLLPSVVVEHTDCPDCSVENLLISI
jgi:hypothetical protein